MQKKWGKPKESMPFPVSLSSHPSSFRAQREIFLAQRSNEERQMRSSRSAHAILSLPHKYRVPLRRKRSLGYARDDDTRERAISYGFSSDHVEGCPLRGRSILRLRRAPSSRGYSAGMQKRNAQAPLTSRWKSQRNENTASPYRHFERSEKSSLHNGQATSVR